ncbi:MAG TPA: T9SS type A sorting domain-containing protein [Tenuifilaceae bacterium]|nr:T9SS type A sorting domain-containing protein [Tenuifilaceae bacterium]HPE18065.1 T9SS type A sorting domain-containing protein [Tenuifilaceae bacterium]HPJ45435.1 T9SS type A sorting domain-containing protein [Tenuifilaceae bacterium]HPQ34052.1 T9SS type A sorting domain-containing protein [Tenuifilaceae bacterium]HRX69250.1 T9SS type A sorting domain-containing protein [Tenuifilaceae bacterium]
MKQLFYIFAGLIIVATSSVSAQNIKLFYNEEDISNSEITIDGTPSRDLKVVINITNTSSSDIQIKIRKRVIENIEGSTNTFCLGECFSPSVEESPNPFTIAAGQTTTSSDFYVEFYPDGNVGTAKIAYEVFNINDENDKAGVTINFNIQEGTSIAHLDLSAMISAYPNPVESNILNISYSCMQHADAKVTVRNIVGVTLLERKIEQENGKIMIDVSSLPNGIYLYSIEQDGRIVATKKLLVNKK